MNPSSIRYLVISDIHLGHPRTKTDYIIKNLMDTFVNNHRYFKELDIIFLAGDIFDKLLSSNSKEYTMANQWLGTVAMYCLNNHIKLRILEGTPSHDWKQAALFDKMLSGFDIGLDHKYVDHLTIEHMEDLGIDILYVPDEWNAKASDTQDEVKALLASRSLDKVDIAIMHGQFGYQLPMIELPSSHNEDYYLSITRYYISIGHIHIHSVYDRILAQGSFDRLAHNEEGDKGCMLINIYHNGAMEFRFIKNPNPQPYRKLDVSDMDVASISKYLDKKFSKFKLGTRVKVLVPGDMVNKLLKPLSEKHAALVITVEKRKKDTKPLVKKIKDRFEPFSITKDNIEGLLSKELVKHGLGDKSMSIVREELMEAM